MGYDVWVHPLVTLTTDFGTRDGYTAELKGVLYAEGPPNLRVADLSHELPPFDVAAAARFLQRAVPRFPCGSVHVVVVDPGVGSARHPLAVEMAGQFLVGPDNGVFGLLFDGSERVYVLDPARASRLPLSQTFHGRDLFAPAAARLAAGLRCDELGTPTLQYQRLSLPRAQSDEHSVRGEVIQVDHYGNLITNVTARDLEALGGPGAVCVACAGTLLEPVRAHYAEVPAGELVCLVGSSGHLEVSAREASAAEKLAVGLGCPVRVAKRG